MNKSEINKTFSFKLTGGVFSVTFQSEFVLGEILVILRPYLSFLFENNVDPDHQVASNEAI